MRTAEGESGAALATLTAALAATENLETKQAASAWSKLRQQRPNDPSVALNSALNAVLRVDALTGQATDSVKSAEEKKRARSALPEAISTARQAAERYAELSGDRVTELWLASRIDAHEATLLGTTIGRSLRRDLLMRLVEAIDGPIGENPRAIILGGTLVELTEKMSDPVEGLPEEILVPTAKALKTLSENHRDNLFLALQALRLAIDRQDPDAAALASRTWQLAAAVEPTLAAFTKPIGLKPEELKDKIVNAIESGDWATADQSLVLWTNVLGPLELLRTDRRRSSPHPLDQLSFETARQLSAELAKQNPLKTHSDPLEFENQRLGEQIAHVLPLDGDLDLDLDLVSISTEQRMVLWRRDEEGWNQNAELSLDVAPTGIIAADLFMVDSSDRERLKRRPSNADSETEPDFSLASRHDTLPSLLIFGDFGVKLIQVDTRPDTPPKDRLTVITGPTGLEEIPATNAVTTGDLEGDGDLDLIIAPQSGSIRCFVNRGNRTFFEVPIGSSTVDADDPIVDMAIADLDRDLDLDVLTIHANSGRISILENLLHLQFRFRNLPELPAVAFENPETLSITVEDVDGNVGWDVIASSDQQSQVAFGNSADIGVWNCDRVETGIGFSNGVVVADFDNDSYFEMLGEKAAVRLGPWGIANLDQDFLIGTLTLGNDATAVDLDGNGVVDCVSAADEQIVVMRNTTSSVGSHLAVRFKGIADNAAASGRVNHYAIGSVLELRFGPHYRSRIVTSPSTHFGLDGMSEADSIRVVMPNGLTQTIRAPEINSIVEEEQTLKGSCPYLYSWDGEKFAFVTDCLWAAPLGLQVASGVVQKDRPWEYLKLDGDLIQPTADGHYELRLTEELWEVAYLDHVELTAVDHPASVEIHTNEKVGPPSVAQPTLYAFAETDLIELRSAEDTHGEEVTELLRQNDERYVKGFDRRIRQGLCPPHWIDLDFGDAAQTALSESDSNAYLVLRGWILPTDTSLNIQIDQNPELPKIEFPSVWVPGTRSDAQDPGNDWERVIDFMGFPGGKTKTIVVDVSEVIKRDDPRLRVRTSAQIYWDSARLAVQKPSAESEGRSFNTHPLRLDSAEVAFHGFSRRIKPGENRPETYDYQQADTQPKWPPLRGTLTDFGPCTDQLTQWDDSMVVISGGDEIRMRFELPEEKLPAGWRRDFILHAVGWDKDADLNTLTGQSIGPLPIRDMSAYPPSAASMERFQSVAEKNAESLRRRQSFRAFWRRNQTTMRPFLPSQTDGTSADKNANLN
jgi:hypothetical protein